jgi:hypothetical protein
MAEEEKKSDGRNNSENVSQWDLDARIDFTIQTLAKLIEQRKQQYGELPAITPFQRERIAVLDMISKFFPNGKEVFQWRKDSGMEKCENEYFRCVKGKAERAFNQQNQFNRIMESHPFKPQENAEADEFFDPLTGKISLKDKPDWYKEIFAQPRNTFRELLPYSRSVLQAPDAILRKLKQRYIDSTGDKREEAVTLNEQEQKILDAVRAGDTDYKTEAQLTALLDKPWAEIKPIVKRLAKKNRLEYRDGYIIG